MPLQTTKQVVEIEDIRDNVVFLRNKSLRTILEVSSTNFELRSEEEQGAILQNFQQFLNSIDFSMQMVVNSRKFEIDDYLKYVAQVGESNSNELLRIQAVEYGKFIKELSDLSNIMSKHFYIVIPFFVSEVQSAAGLASGLSGLFSKSKKTPEEDKVLSEEKFQTYKNQLIQRSEVVLDGLVGLGLKARVLEQEELKNVFFSLYNPGIKKQS